MKLLRMLKRFSLMPMVQQIDSAEGAQLTGRLPARLVRRHSAFLYYSQRHYAQQRREA